MVRRWKIGLIFGVFIIIMLSGCSQRKAIPESERTEIDFTIVEERDIPEKLLEIIEGNKKEEMRLSYTDEENLYLVRGYGQQKTGGYSIAVAECTEDEKTIWFDTRLLGPENQEMLSEDPSCPYLVVRIEMREKEIMID